MTRQDEVRETLEKLGGIAEVAAALNLTRRAIQVWIRTGRMPHYRRAELAEMAQGKVVLSEYLFVAGAKRGRKRNAETKEASAA